MPELPEVETTRRGIAPHVAGRRVVRIDVYDPRLRWPVPADLAARIRGRTIDRVDRRSKYLLFHLGAAALLVHLGMTGTLRVFRDRPPRGKHDHVDIVLDDGTLLRYRRIVTGVGNIYANEALFRAGIRPTARANRVSKARLSALVDAVRDVLRAAIAKGGSTLRDYVGSDGAAGYFQLDYFVYGREGDPCRACGTPVRQLRIGQRSSFYCPRCQRA
ncbi:MAG TPA: Fpg/Nei family DNA glycosylase [Casimicrobiaceae bacterium]